MASFEGYRSFSLKPGEIRPGVKAAKTGASEDEMIRRSIIITKRMALLTDSKMKSDADKTTKKRKELR